MNKTIHVDVTQQRIDEGEHGCICACPISGTIGAEADIEDVSVHKDDGHLTEIKVVEDVIPSPIEGNQPIKRTFREKFVYRFKLPKIAQEFVRKWDAREKVEPIEFDIEPVFWAKNTGNYTVPTKYDTETIT